MHDHEGSYDFDRFQDADFQADRLKQQAHAIRALESGLLRQAGLEPHHAVLEIGSGPGFVSDLLAELAPEGSLHAVEPSKALIERIAHNVKSPPRQGLYLHPTRGDAIALPDASIDFAYARFVLQHVPTPLQVIREAYRLLKPGGRFCVVDSDDGLILIHPTQPKVQALLEKAQSMQAVQGGNRFVGRTLQGLLAEAGFHSLRTRIISMTSTELPFETLFNILFGYKLSMVTQPDERAALYAELEADVHAARRMLSAGVFVVTGEKKC